MFFVSMLLNELIAWMRAQPGTSSLRAILYMDEIFGYMPPTANPPTKRLLLTLLKQARAFGIGPPHRVADPDGHGAGKPHRYHEHQGGEVDGHQVSGCRHRAEPSDQQCSQHEQAAFHENRTCDRQADLEQLEVLGQLVDADRLVHGWLAYPPTRLRSIRQVSSPSR